MKDFNMWAALTIIVVIACITEASIKIAKEKTEQMKIECELKIKRR